MRIIAVIPCLNEARFVSDVVTEALRYVDAVVVADDNSENGTMDVAKSAGAEVVGSWWRKDFGGAGWNTYHGMCMARLRGADIVVTLDGDGQHRADEIPLLVAPIVQGLVDVAIGVRKDDGQMPRYRRFGNRVIRWLYNIGARQKTTDAQCCFRAFNRAVLEQVWLQERGFGFSTETLVKARALGFRMADVPVSCVYFDDYSRNSTLGPVRHGLGVAWATVKWRVLKEILGR